MWFGALLNMQQLRINDNNKQDVYLKLAASELPGIGGKWLQLNNLTDDNICMASGIRTLLIKPSSAFILYHTEASWTMARVLLKFPIAILAILLANGALQTLARCRYTSDYNDFDGDGDNDGGDLTCLYPWSTDGNVLPAEPRTSFYSDQNNCLRV
ncbi:hypothetical protein RJ639_044460 [Escallonia herrerae]|uniref:Uncharacterized protein n=1 Tax=Escallonia herrerae TaxID=1293975 RepID=A0AA88W9Y9_9ASTE|nr:hypothetical protein RJ639_044460 [Escallonia herrerae]